MRDAERAALPAALSGVTAEMQSAVDLGDRELSAFFAEIAAFLKLTGGGWPAEQRQEWIEQASAELGVFPVSLVIEAVREARRRVHQPSRFVSWVLERIEADVEKLRKEADLLERLAEIAAQ